jgi:hypothetical protein
MKKLLLPIGIAVTPAVASAQVFFTGNPSIQDFFANLLDFINSTLIPFLFGLAFLLFAFNVIKYFVVGGGNKDAQEDAKNIALYSIGAFVFLIIFWGIVNLLVDSIGVGPANCTQPTTDYYNGPTPPPCY